MNTGTYNDAPITYYFSNDGDAQNARNELIDSGLPADDVSLQTKGSSKSFLDGLKSFFGVESSERYTAGTLLTVDYADGDSQIEDIVRRYGGQVRDDYRGQFAEDEQRMRLREERLSVDKQPVSEGEVRLRKEVITENQTVDVPVHREEVYVERRGVTGRSQTDEGGIAEGEEIRVPVMHEEVSVEKHPVATEEVVIGKRTFQDKQTVGASVRKERARVETEGDVKPRTSLGDE